jgi:hypothetical protein
MQEEGISIFCWYLFAKKTFVLQLTIVLTTLFIVIPRAGKDLLA